MDIADMLDFTKKSEENSEKDKSKEENLENKETSENKNDNEPKVSYTFGEEFNKAYGDRKTDDFQK